MLACGLDEILWDMFFEGNCSGMCPLSRAVGAILSSCSSRIHTWHKAVVYIKFIIVDAVSRMKQSGPVREELSKTEGHLPAIQQSVLDAFRYLRWLR